MATRNISGIIAGNYTLSGVYASLVIEPAAEIQGQLFGNSQADTITNLGGTVTNGVALTAGGTIANDTIAARITGYNGSNGIYPSGAGGSGGAGINLAGGGSIINDGTIGGGSGGDGGDGLKFTFSSGGYGSDQTEIIDGGSGGVGGAGISLAGGGSIANSGMIVGGNGGYRGAGDGGSGTAGSGGAGINLVNGGSIGNSGTIAGGHGGTARAALAPTVATGGSGGAGISLSAGGALDNSGTITGGSGAEGGAHVSGGHGGSGGAAVSLAGGGAITNSGAITGGQGGEGGEGFPGGTGGTGGAGGTGIVLSGGGTMMNSGTITGGQGGVGGYGGTIVSFPRAPGGTGGAGGTGISLSAGGTVTNTGTVVGGNGGAGGFGNPYGATGQFGFAGVELTAGGVVINGSIGATTAWIGGGIGIDASGAADATVITYGTIAAASIAVSFGGGGNNLLALGAGYHLAGIVRGSTAPGSTNTLELLGALGHAVAVNYNGLGLTNFQDVLFGAGGYATLAASNTTGTLGVPIRGFIQNSETIDLTSLAGGTLSNGGIPDGSGQLVVSNGVETVRLQFDGSDATLFEAHADAGTGTDIVALCFLRGTLIRTPLGEAPVETLSVGDRIVTLSGAVQSITWIGIGRNLVKRGKRSAATPVLVRKDALGDNVPHHDLRITKGHSLFLDGVLIPVECLINHRSIAWDDHAQEVEFYHIELSSHDVLLANGARAETYRDDGNRWLFRNANSGWDLPPLEPCAPILTGGPIVDAIWRRLLDRSGPRPAMPLTGDADLHRLQSWTASGWMRRPAIAKWSRSGWHGLPGACGSCHARQHRISSALRVMRANWVWRCARSCWSGGAGWC